MAKRDAAKAENKGVSRGGKRTKGHTGNTPANKLRSAASRAHHLLKAAQRRHSDDYTTPEHEFRADGAIKVRKGTCIRRGTKRHTEIMVSRRNQTIAIETKRETRDRLRSLDPGEAIQRRRAGRKQFNPKGT
jgi:hypothetical protein